jgi:hypothetical protein
LEKQVENLRGFFVANDGRRDVWYKSMKKRVTKVERLTLVKGF